MAISKPYKVVAETNSRRQIVNSIAFGEMKYDENIVKLKNMNTDARENNSKLSLLVFTEYENCIRIIKPKSLSPFSRKQNAEQSQDYRKDVQRSNEHMMKVNINSQNNSNVTWRASELYETNDITLLGNQSNKNYSCSNNKLSIKSISYLPNDKVNISQSRANKAVRYQNLYRSDAFNSFETRDSKLPLGREQVGLKEEEGEKLISANDPGKVGTKITTGPKDVLKQRKLDELDTEEIFNLQENLKTYRTMNDYVCSSNVQKSAQLGGSDKNIQRKINKLSEISTRNLAYKTKGKVSEPDNNSVEENKLRQFLREEFKVTLKENCDSKIYSQHSQTMKGAKRYNEVCNDGIAWRESQEERPNEIGSVLKTNHPFCYPQYVFTEGHNQYPTSYFMYVNPDMLQYPYYWWSPMPLNCQAPVAIPNENIVFSPITLPLVQPYTGVAGYNWPTIRKPLKNDVPEEKNEYPVYVKPPVIGNERTEQIRMAFIKYVKVIKFKLYMKSVRKIKQKKRRERNYQSLMKNVSGKSDVYESIGMELQEEKNPEKLPHSEDKSVSGRSQPIDYHKNNEECWETKPWTPASYKGSERLDGIETTSTSECGSETETKELNGRDPLDDASSETPFEATVNLESDSFEISENELPRDFLREVKQDKNYNLERKNPVQSTHPIYGPVCRWKEAFLDEYITSSMPSGYDKL